MKDKANQSNVSLVATMPEGKQYIFTPDRIHEDKKGEFVQWGSWGANFWFCAGFGKSWATALSYAQRRLCSIQRGGTVKRVIAGRELN